MAPTFSETFNWSALILAALLASGCPSGRQEGNNAEATQPEKEVSHVQAKPVAQVSTEERFRLDKARDYLDSAENALSLRVARGLLDSKDPEILSGLVDIFGWVGRRAMPELEELVARNVSGVSNRALDAWEMVVDEIPGEYSRAVAITNAIEKITDPVVIDAMLMHIVSIREDCSLPALEGVIVRHRGKVAAECAKVMFCHVAGEPYSSPERTKKLMRKDN